MRAKNDRNDSFIKTQVGLNETFSDQDHNGHIVPGGACGRKWSACEGRDSCGT